MRRLSILVLAACSSLGVSQGFFDTFDSIHSDWVQDRYDTKEFTTEFFDGDNRLRINVGAEDGRTQRPGSYSSTFYDYQGRQRTTGALGTGIPWRISGDMYVSQDMMTGTATRYNTGLWARDSALNENDAHYPIAAFGRFDPSNVTAGTNFQSVLSAWDAQNGGWNRFALSTILPTFTGNNWLNIAMEYDGNAVRYFANGVLYYTDTTASPILQGSAKTVFINSYNFDSGQDTVYYWDNVYAGTPGTVPEPFTAGLVGAAAVAAYRRKRRARRLA